MTEMDTKRATSKYTLLPRWSVSFADFLVYTTGSGNEALTQRLDVRCSVNWTPSHSASFGFY